MPATLASAPAVTPSSVSESSAERAAAPLRIGLPRDGALCEMLGDQVVDRLDQLTGLSQIDALYQRVRAIGPMPIGPAGVPIFCRRVLADLKVRMRLSIEDKARIPTKGPLIVVANHPFGALDGIVLAAVLSEARPDLKILANYLLSKVPELEPVVTPVDPFAGAGAVGRNLGPMRDALRWLKQGHVLAAFPGGEVGHLKLRNLFQGESAVTDPPWNDAIARLARKAGVPVLPLFFNGSNDALFQAAGLLHPRLRTALLPRALLKQRGSTVTLRIGSIIPAARLARFEDDGDATGYLRRRTFLLRYGAPKPSISTNQPTAVAPAAASATREASTAQASIGQVERTTSRRSPLARLAERAARMLRTGRGPSAAKFEPVIDPVDPSLMEAEIAALPHDAMLLEHDEMLVVHAKAAEIRHTLREVGRLREITFRQVGEGTGKSLDLDTFDYDYRHLLIWNRAARQIVGAYRLGQTDLLLPAKGRQGLYTSSLFNYKAELLERLNPALEMGRSFVRPEYQKSYAPLLLLWKGIGHFLVRHPQYRYLFGPVSISNSYQTVSRQLMVKFLQMHHAMPEGQSLAEPKNPFKPGRAGRLERGLGLGRGDPACIRQALSDDDEVSSLIADVEPDQKGLPVLIRQYLKLGAKFVAFNVDRDFGDCLDGLIVVDLLGTEARVLERYMTKPGYADFVASHRRRTGEVNPAPIG